MSAGARAVVFDLDGTLVDSAADIHAAVAAMLADLGRPTLSQATVTGFVGRGARRLVERCLDATGGTDPALATQALARFESHYAAAPVALTTLYPGAVAMLSALTEAGRRLGVCTNKPQALADQVVAGLDLGRFFGAVVGGGATAAIKPDPAPLDLCLARLGLGRDACLYVGDSETDAETAAAAGVPFALYLGGYRHGPAEAMAADFVFDDFAAATAWMLARG